MALEAVLSTVTDADSLRPRSAASPRAGARAPRGRWAGGCSAALRVRSGAAPRARGAVAGHPRLGGRGDLAPGAAAAPARGAVQGAARRTRRPLLLGAQPRPADGRGQRDDPARHLQLERAQLAPAGDGLRRPGRHRADRLGRAEEFWVVSEPSLPRAAPGSPSATSRTAQVVGSYSTRVDAADPFRQMMAAACAGPDDCWFGGVGSQDALGERIGAFHLHWNGSDLRDFYGPQGRGISDIEFHAGSSTRARWSGAAGEPDRPGRARRPRAGAEPASHDRRRRLRQRPVHAGAAPRGAGRRHRAARARQRRHDLWAVGGGAASGPSAPAGGAVPRPPLAARLVARPLPGAQL